jgi:hypothetical protein
MEKADKKTVGNAKDAKKPPYEANPIELEAIKAYRAAKAKEAPRLKLEEAGKGEVNVAIDHPDKTVGTLALLKALGTSDFDFYGSLLGQLINASKEAGSRSAARISCFRSSRELSRATRSRLCSPLRWPPFIWPR